jgi:hypothetical protein
VGCHAGQEKDRLPEEGWQAADKILCDGHQSAYEKEAQFLYGLLRAAWERALEEVLLEGVVERFRPDSDVADH